MLYSLPTLQCEPDASDYSYSSASWKKRGWIKIKDETTAAINTNCQPQSAFLLWTKLWRKYHSDYRRKGDFLSVWILNLAPATRNTWHLYHTLSLSKFGRSGSTFFWTWYRDSSKNSSCISFVPIPYITNYNSNYTVVPVQTALRFRGWPCRTVVLCVFACVQVVWLIMFLDMYYVQTLTGIRTVSKTYIFLPPPCKRFFPVVVLICCDLTSKDFPIIVRNCVTFTWWF